MHLKKKINSNGSSLLEFCITLPLVISAFVLFSSTTYLFFAKFMLSRTLHNALICLAEKQPPSLCKNLFKTKLDLFLPLSTFSISDMKDKDNYYHIKYDGCYLMLNPSSYFCLPKKEIALTDQLILEKIKEL